MEKFAKYGFQFPNNLVMSFIGGSQMHGAKIPGTDDTDIYGVYIEPPELVLGLDKSEHFVYTTGGKVGGNGPQDIDITLYGLQKFCRLAAKGNPSMLHFLFAKPEFQTIDWMRVMRKSDIFLAKSHYYQFVGFANAQYERLCKGRGQKNVHRQELEEKFGYDTKYAMHIIRLYQEAIELLETGQITLPRPNKEALIDIRLGVYKLNEIDEYAQQLQATAETALKASRLPEKVDRVAISNLMTETYRNFWEDK